MGKKISTTIYITDEQCDKLKKLSQKTRVPVAEYIRQGIDSVIDKYKAELPGEQLELLTSFSDKQGNESN